MNQPTPCVYIVDDDPAVRDALSILVQSVNLRLQTFETADAFLQAFDPAQPGCLISDVCLPGTDGLSLQHKLKERDIHLPTIVISGHGDIPLAVKMVRNGALDFLEKPFRNHVMLKRIREALVQDAEQRAVDVLQSSVIERFNSLTPREREVLGLLIEGSPNKRIASMLELSPRTVETHRANILRKMAMGSVTGLAKAMQSLRNLKDPF